MDADRLREQLTRQEAYRRVPYKDTVGKWTWGVGRNLDDVGLSKEEVLVLLTQGTDACIVLCLTNDISKANHLASQYTWFPTLNDQRQNVIINIIFNMGKASFDKFVNTQKAISVGDIEGAANGLEHSLWYKQVGARAVELVKQWRTGEWVS